MHVARRLTLALALACAGAACTSTPERDEALARAREEARLARARTDEAAGRAAQAEARAARAEARVRALESGRAKAAPAAPSPGIAPGSDGPAACPVCFRDDQPVGFIDGLPLRLGDYKEFLLRYVGPSTLDLYIDEHLVLEAAEAAGIVPGADEIAAWVDEKVRLTLEHPDLKGRGDPETLRIQYAAHARLGLTIERIAVSRRGSDEWLRREFERRYGERRRARHILYRSEAPEGSPDDGETKRRAERGLARIRAGGDFAEIARRESQDGSAAQGGELGEFGRADVVPEFADVAFALKEGQVSEPVRSRHGWHLIEITRIVPAAARRFEDGRDELAAEAKVRPVSQEEVDDLLAELRSKAKIEKRVP